MSTSKKENYGPKEKNKKKKIQRKKNCQKVKYIPYNIWSNSFIRKFIKTWPKAAKRAMLFENHWIVKIVIVSIVKIVIVSENADRFGLNKMLIGRYRNIWKRKGGR